MIIAEIPKANHCSFFCFLLTIDECIINVWGYTEILPGKILKDNLLAALSCFRVRQSAWLRSAIASPSSSHFDVDDLLKVARNFSGISSDPKTREFVRFPYV